MFDDKEKIIIKVDEVKLLDIPLSDADLALWIEKQKKEEVLRRQDHEN